MDGAKYITYERVRSLCCTVVQQDVHRKWSRSDALPAPGSAAWKYKAVGGDRQSYLLGVYSARMILQLS